MDFFKLLKQGKYKVTHGDLTNINCWPDSRYITLFPKESQAIWIIYNIKTLFVHLVLMIASGKGIALQETLEELKIDDMMFCWYNPESKRLYLASEESCLFNEDDIIEIEDENEMNFVTLKLKYM